MASPTWQISGQYYETCNCEVICPCILGQMAAEPSHGACMFAMAFTIEQGAFGSLPLDGLAFIVLGLTPGVMGQGNWSVGIVADERASAEQRDAITTIASGASGGPMAAISGLVGTFLGVETAPIRITEDGVTWSATAGTLVDMAAKGMMGVNPDAIDPMQLTNTGHPASDTLGLYRALKSHVNAMGLSWDTSGGNNGHHAPFAWRSA